MTKRWFAGVVVVVAGCSDPASSIDAAGGDDAASDGPATTDGAGGDGATAVDSRGPDATPGDCPSGQLCLNVNKVVPAATIPGGRLVVVFYQFIDDATPYPPLFAGLDVAFSGTSARIDTALAQVTLPAAIDDYQLCPRACLDLGQPACDCPPAQPKAALAFVFVIQDVDGSGGIDPAELVEENIYGVGYLQLAAADADYPAPNVLDPLFTEGILNGLVPYEVIDPPTSIFDVLAIPPAGTVFDLDVCVPGDASCDLVRFPNLT
jgi:hypothetical protein